MQHLRRLVVVASFFAVWLAVLSAQGSPPSTWPALFPGATDGPVNESEWEEAKAGAGGVSFRVPHPKTWVVRASHNPLVTIMSPTGRQFVQISEPQALPKPIPLPFPVDQIQRATESLSAVIGAHDFQSIGGGQALAAGRWWLWQDQFIPTTTAASRLRLPPEIRDVFAAEVDSMHLWIFVTSVDTALVQVFCWALLPRGLTPADLDRELRPAAAVFDRMIKRMVLQKTPS